MKSTETRPQDMTLDEAVKELERHGSDDDPITYHGEETTPRQLTWKLDDHQSAAHVRIGYAGGTRGKLKMVRNGTLSGMVRNRRELSQTPQRRKRKNVCPSCGQKRPD